MNNDNVWVLVFILIGAVSLIAIAAVIACIGQAQRKDPWRS